MANSDPYPRGLQDLGDGCHAWLEPPGSWGLSNSGIVVGEGEVLVIDTQNDMRRAGDLRAAVEKVAGGLPVRTVVNTHGDSDHWSGNILFDGAQIISSDAALHQMQNILLDPSELEERSKEDTEFARWVRWRMQEFDYEGWRPVYPTDTFSGTLSMTAAGEQVELIEVGPAHTAGDTIVHLPSRGLVFSADIIFAESTPIVWTGPISRCIAACDLILDLEPSVVVPGHGKVVGPEGVRTARDYFVFVEQYANEQAAAGRTPEEAYEAIKLGPYASWPHASRVYQSIRFVYAELLPDQFPANPLESLETVLEGDDGHWKDSVPGGHHHAH
jgi:glyoxylase-like metal-dependent hydrolase (beta-lactamase superfamily II)